MNSNSVRPTLYIGLGGTGGDVLLQLRQKILMNSWGQQGEKVKLSSLSEFPCAQFIHFDLDKGFVIDSGRAQSEDLLFNSIKFTEDEKIVESFNIERYCRDDDVLDNDVLDRYPNIKEWLPLTPKKIRELNIDPSKGAGQIRAISRLYFFDKYTKLRDKIRFKLKTLKAGLSYETQLNKLGLKTEFDRFRIVVVCSIAGSTGSGSFLDMGWLARWLAESEGNQADVELMLFMPTAYSGANKYRTEANAYAALMELEAAMRGNKSYVPRWDSHDSPVLNSTPYSEVYLVDSENLAHQYTRNISDLYPMLADILFEDFASSEFASKKRSVAVNQAQHKNTLFDAEVSQNRFDDMRLSFSKCYSSLGQSILDTKIDLKQDIRVHLWTREMLKAFLGVGSNPLLANRASDKQCDDFLDNYIGLQPILFNELPQFSNRSFKLKLSSGEFIDYVLVNELLADQNGSLIVEVAQRVNDRINSIKTSFDLKEWPSLVRLAFKEIEQDLVKDQDSTADTIEDRISKRRRELLDTRKKTIQDQLYAYLDNKELGGLENVLTLLVQMKDKIEAQGNGAITNLQVNAERYKEIKEAVRTREFEHLVTHLEKTINRFSLFGNNKKQSVAIMDHLRTEIANSIKFHLRAKAAEEACIFLNELSIWLGKKIGLDNNGIPIWNGLVGEFQTGREAVFDMLQSLEHSGTILQANLKKEYATLIYIAAPEYQIPTPNTAQMYGWAVDVIEELGGSQQVLEMLAESDKKEQVLSKMYKMAERQLLAVAQVGDNTVVINPLRIEWRGLVAQVDDNTVVIDPLIEALEEMNVTTRLELFKKWIAHAMPWVDANLSGNFTLKADQYQCIIGVSNDELFKRKFGNELKVCIPYAGISSVQLDIVTMGLNGKAVCYSELSGFPLTALSSIESWRTSYSNDLVRLPLHTHIDVTQFSHPIAPGSAELNSLAEDFKIFLLSVMTGILSRAKQKGIPAGQYEFELSKGDCRRVGNERSIRQNGLVLQFREAIISQVEKLLNNADGYVLAVLSALASYYATQVYAPRLVVNENGVEVLRKGFASTMAKELSDELRDKAVIKELSIVQIEEIAEKLLDANSLKEWAIAITGSDEDVYEWEVSELGEGGEPHLKYVIKPQILNLSHVNAMIQSTFNNSNQPARPLGNFATSSSVNIHRNKSILLFLYLKTKGLITQEEFDILKTQLLNKLNHESENIQNNGINDLTKQEASFQSISGMQQPLSSADIYPPIKSSLEYLITINGEQHGPYDFTKMMQMVQAGQAELVQACWHEERQPISILPPITSHQYFIGINGEQHGPYNFPQMMQMVQAGQVGLTTKVWREGFKVWVDLNTLPEATSLLGINTTTPPPHEPVNDSV